MAQSGPEDDFYSYTQEWTKAISRGGVFEVSNVAFLFFRKLDLLMRELLPPHLIKCTMDRAENKTYATIHTITNTEETCAGYT